MCMMPEKPKLWKVTVYAEPSGGADPLLEQILDGKCWLCPITARQVLGWFQAVKAGQTWRLICTLNPLFAASCATAPVSEFFAAHRQEPSLINSPQHCKSGFQGWQDRSSNLGSHYTGRALFYLSLCAPSSQQRNKAMFVYGAVYKQFKQSLGSWACKAQRLQFCIDEK